MAVDNPTLLTSGGSDSGGGSGAGSDTTASISPTGDSLLLAYITTITNGGPGDITISDTLTGTGTWTEISITNSETVGSFFYAVAGSSPGSGTITFTYSVNANRRSWIVAEVTTFDSTTPESENSTNSGSGSTLSDSVAGVAAGNLVVSCCGDRNNSTGITVGTGETELAEVTSGGTQQARSQMQYSTDTAHDWAGLASSQNVCILLEINDDPGGGGRTTFNADPRPLGVRQGVSLWRSGRNYGRTG